MTPGWLRTRLPFLFALLLGLSFAVAGPSPAAHAGPADPTEPDVVVAGADGDLLPFFPDVTRLHDGRLVTVFYQAPTHSGSVPGPHQGKLPPSSWATGTCSSPSTGPAKATPFSGPRSCAALTAGGHGLLIPR